MNTIIRLMPLLASFSAWPALAQSWDSSGNGLLNGTSYFRQVVWVTSDGADLSEAIAIYGNIIFDGKGSYTVNATLFDGGGGTTSAYSTSGSYVIGASGLGWINSPANSILGSLAGVSASDQVYGLVSKGVFIGSATENSIGYNDMFISAPVGANLATNATLTGTYMVADVDNPTGNYYDARDALLQFSADGNGNLTAVSASGYIANNQGSGTKQTFSGVKYSFSNGAANVFLGGSFTNSNFYSTLLVGNHYLYVSPDGNFVFGGSPNGFDMFVGVRADGSASKFTGLAYQTGMDFSTDLSSFASYDSYWGSLIPNLFGHERLLSTFTYSPYDLTYGDSVTFNADGSADDSFEHYIYGGGGTLRIGLDKFTSQALGISVAVAAPAFSGSGVYLNPTGILNAGSSGLFTSSLSPGELISLYGTNLAADVTSNYLMPTTLDGVQVLINGIAAPIYVTSPTELTVMVPYEVTGSIAQIQVVNKGAPSNTIPAFIGLTSPGVLTKPVGGLGYAAARHSDGFTEITPSSPAQIGETISIYVTGLGAVSPVIASGSPGPSDTPSTTVNQIDAYVGGTQAMVSFEGLTPTVIGLYQVNLTIPAGIPSGDNVIELAGPDSDSFEARISIGGTAAASVSAKAAPHVKALRRQQTAAVHKERSEQLRRLPKPLQP